MKKWTMLLILATCVCAVQAQTNFYTTVTNSWYQGDKSNVFVMAESRLAQNTNDIAGLILKLECQFAWLDLPQLSNSVLRVIQVGDTITSTNFVQKFQIERQELLDDLELLRTYPTTEELQTERQKGNISQKELPTFLFDALYKDGYFNP
jgi:hypothetical protein